VLIALLLGTSRKSREGTVLGGCFQSAAEAVWVAGLDGRTFAMAYVGLEQRRARPGPGNAITNPLQAPEIPCVPANLNRSPRLTHVVRRAAKSGEQVHKHGPPESAFAAIRGCSAVALLRIYCTGARFCCGLVWRGREAGHAETLGCRATRERTIGSTPPLMCWPCRAPRSPRSSSQLTIPSARDASGWSFSALSWRLAGVQRERAGRRTREHQPSVYMRADVAQAIPYRCPTSRWSISPTHWRGSQHSGGASSTPVSDGQSAETPREARSA
jgi:hypothetical protein